MTLDRFLVQRQQKRPGASGELTRVLEQLGTVAKIISNYARRSALEGLKGDGILILDMFPNMPALKTLSHFAFDSAHRVRLTLRAWLFSHVQLKPVGAKSFLDSGNCLSCRCGFLRLATASRAISGLIRLCPRT